MLDINTLSIVHYCHQNTKPFLNICRLEEVEAYRLAYKMAKENPDVTSFGRFKDFSNYYPERMQQDKWLYQEFIAIGGEPKELHPLSFVLEGSDYLQSWFSDGQVYRLKLVDIQSSVISFTLGDSMSMFKKQGSLRMLRKEELVLELKKFQNIDDLMKDINERYRYIEVQLWDEQYVRDIYV